MMNSTRYAGTCRMHWNYGWTTGYGEGKAIAKKQALFSRRKPIIQLMFNYKRECVKVLTVH